MNMFTTEATIPATLTEHELFARFLDAPLRFGSASSLLAPKESEEDARYHYFSYYGLDVYFLPDELPDLIIEALECSETPCDDLEAAIGELECMVSTMQTAHDEFKALCDATLTEAPDEEAPTDVYWQWRENPRYVLPITPTDGKNRLATHNTGPNEGIKI